MPGLGHAYVGAPLRGIAIVVGAGLASTALLVLHVSATGVVPSLATLVAAVVVVLAAGGFAIIDAGRIASRPRTRFTARGSILLVCLGFAAAASVLQLAWERWSNQVLPDSYRVPSRAMLPTLMIGDHLYADPRAYDTAAPARGDVVIVRAVAARFPNRAVRPDPELPTETVHHADRRHSRRFDPLRGSGALREWRAEDE